MKKLLILATLASLATVSSAQWYRTGYVNSDAYVDGGYITSSSGYLNIQWTGYVTNYTPGRSTWRVKIWDYAVSTLPVADESFAAYANSTNYSRNYHVFPGHQVKVELYAASFQYPTTNPLSTHVCTYLWIMPI